MLPGMTSTASITHWQALGLEAVLDEVLPELIQLRRHIHRHPELSGHEQQTAADCKRQLKITRDGNQYARYRRRQNPRQGACGIHYSTDSA